MTSFDCQSHLLITLQVVNSILAARIDIKHMDNHVPYRATMAHASLDHHHKRARSSSPDLPTPVSKRSKTSTSSSASSPRSNASGFADDMIPYDPDEEDLLNKKHDVQQFISNLTRVASILEHQAEVQTPDWFHTITSTPLFTEVGPIVAEYLAAVEKEGPSDVLPPTYNFAASDSLELRLAP
ncbi:uncharacterized protein EI90DRAFT_3290726 [Cantharellus anzutake]|uniref:uncharacterized protein n=1 Tax=Cantharellus anzutake TaxID=1750568 RepID=UPI001907C24E|nr:uncharacterized protein EI90DRAFT_3290726 [Cantharellus anzutake]KAF8328243.1 hypothetical protein EI90DRAFT_3290726 [Cantharellus anzutake]